MDINNLNIFRDSEVKTFLGFYFGQSEIESLEHFLSQPPLETTLRVNTLKVQNIEISIDLLKEILKKEEKEEFPIKLGHILPECLMIPCIYNPNLKQPPNLLEIIVDCKCGESILRGAHIFAPGVLGAQTGIKKGDKVAVLIDIERKVKRGFMKLYEGPKLFIGIGIAQMNRAEFYTSESGVAIRMTDCIYSTPALNSIPQDIFYLQNIPSMIAAYILNPKPGETILDMCAAPGGKTTHIAALMKNQGKLIACEKVSSKIDELKNLCSIMGTSIVQVLQADSTKLLESEAFKNLFPNQEILFDRILLDPPCSGLGQRPKIRVDLNLVALKGYSPYQRKLMYTAVELLKVGGTLVYSTCTLNPLENEEIVRFALDTFPLELDTQSVFVGSKGLCWEDKFSEEERKKLGIGKSLTQKESNLVQRFNPTSSNSIGFFIAKFIKTKKEK